MIFQQSLPGDGRYPSALCHLGTLNGSTHPPIIHASDNRPYVLKFRESAGRFGLIGEAMGTEIMRAVGLPVPDWKPVYVDDEFLNTNPGVWYGGVHRTHGTRPTVGPHFGSRLIYSPDPAETYDCIPGRWIPRVRNRSDFAGAFIVDLWMNNCDRRQCVFVRADTAGGLRAVFIDHGHMFGGFYGDEKANPRRCIYPDIRFYESIWTPENVAMWKERIRGIDDRALLGMFLRVPVEWAPPGVIIKLHAQLIHRRNRLESFVSDIENFLTGSNHSLLYREIAHQAI